MSDEPWWPLNWGEAPPVTFDRNGRQNVHSLMVTLNGTHWIIGRHKNDFTVAPLMNKRGGPFYRVTTLELRALLREIAAGRA